MDLKIVSLNVNSLVDSSRKLLLGDFMRDNPAPIYCVQETKLREIHKLHFHGFNILRQNNPSGINGTAIIIKNNIPIRKFKTKSGNIEYSSVEAQIQNEWIKIFSYYINTNGKASQSVFNKALKITGQLLHVFAGDSNSRHEMFGDISRNVNGIKLAACAENPGIKILNPTSPSCYRSPNGSYIDKFIIGNIRSTAISNVSVLPSFSDHFGISISINMTLTAETRNGFTIRRFNFTQINPMNKFIERKTKQLVIPLNDSLENGDLETITTDFKKILEDSVKKYVPLAKIKTNKIMLSTQSLALQRESKKLQRKIHRLNPGLANAVLLSELRTKLSHCKKMVLGSIRSDIAKYYANMLTDTQNPRDAFRTIKFNTSHKKSSKLGGHLFTNDDKNECISGNQNIVEALATNFEANHNLINDTRSMIEGDVANSITNLNNRWSRIQFGSRITPKIESQSHLDEINGLLPDHQQNILTNSGEINDIIRSRPNKKSTGSDEMPYYLIKFFSPQIILFITILFNHLLSNSYFPKIWRTAQIIPILKANKDPSIITNWRPISQLQCISKIFEKLIANRLTSFTHSKNLFETQYGFQRNLSTEHALGKIQSDIDSGLNNGMATSIISLDLRAAFDVMWHDGLIHKLIKLEFQPMLIKLIQNMLTQRSFSVKLDGIHSTERRMRNGSPQGSVVSPLIFNIYVHDIPKNANVKLTQFADDTSIYLTHKRPIWAQNTINWYLMNLSQYFKRWKLLLNESKTEFINVVGTLKDTTQNLRKKCNEMKISLNGKKIRNAKSIRFLGLHIQKNNRFTGHVNIKLEKARRAKMALNKILRSRLIDCKVKTLVYKLYIRPIITYAAPIWCRQPHTSSHQMEMIRIFERGCLRSTANIQRNRNSFRHVKIDVIYRKADCVRIDRYIANNSLNFFNRCLNSKFTRVRKLIQNPNPTDYGYKCFNHLAHLSESDQLFINGKFLYFHKAYGSNRSVYNDNQ